MTFLIKQVSLEAELQLNVSMPVSSTPSTAPTNASGLHNAAAQPSSSPACTSDLLHSSQLDAAAGIHKAPASSLEPHPQRASYRSSSSRLRLPALPPGSARSPRISARYPGLHVGGGAAHAVEPSGSARSPRTSARYPGLDTSGGAAKEVEPASGRMQLPAGFVSTGDLEEDTQQLLEMGSEVQVLLHFLLLCLLSVAPESVVQYCAFCIE